MSVKKCFKKELSLKFPSKSIYKKIYKETLVNETAQGSHVYIKHAKNFRQIIKITSIKSFENIPNIFYSL